MTKQRKGDNTMEVRYQRAQTLMQGYWSDKDLVPNALLFPHWIGKSDCFWYERTTKTGKQYRMVDAKAATNEIAFDHAALGRALAKALEQKIDADDLPINKVKINLSPLQVSFTAFSKHWVFEEKSESCKEVEPTSEDRVLSPDGRHAVFTRDYNLWLRDMESGVERTLTGDGEDDYVYAAVGSAWGFEQEAGLQVQWSPDSKRLFAVQRDTRQVKTLPVVQHVPQDGSLRPTVDHIKVAYPGDDHVEEYRLVVIDVDSGEIRDVNYRRIPVCRNSPGFFNAGLGWWAMDSRRAYFVDQERGDQVIRVVELDAHTGATRVLFEETSNTQFNLMLNSDESPMFLPLPESNELIWYSERSGWAHLYLYDLDTGELKSLITQGEWLVRDVLHFDAQGRAVFVQTAARIPDRNLYYRDLCRIHVDTGEITALATSDHEYIVATQKSHNFIMAKGFGYDDGTAAGVSPSGHFVVVTRSRVDEVPVSLLLDRDGKEILELETADISALPEGWQWPEPVKVLAADGKTDIYGLIFRPSDFSPDKIYPVVSHVFNTPELPWVARGSFSSGGSLGFPYFDAAALAELGFIVVQIDGRGTPNRNKAFHDESYGRLFFVNHPDDHVAGIRQLAERYPYMDLDRVGITCHSSGGPGGVQGLLIHPDFYKVGVNMCLHDSRLIAATMWGDKYEGMSGPAADSQYPEQLVEKLQGKLMLMHGMLDACVPPASTFRLVDALVRANKDFDMLMLPTMSHDISSYAVRRAWDYLVTHLLGVKPPKEFNLTTGLDLLKESGKFAVATVESRP